jgi:hypothetical protein
MEKKEVLLPAYNKSTAFSDEERKKFNWKDYYLRQ